MVDLEQTDQHAGDDGQQHEQHDELPPGVAETGYFEPFRTALAFEAWIARP